MAKREAKQDRTFIYAAIGLVIIVAVVIFTVRLIPEKRLPTLDELFDELEAGEVSEGMFLYNGYPIVEADGLWYTKVQSGNTIYTVPLHYSPKQLEDVPFKGFLSGFMTYMRNNPIDGVSPSAYVTFDPTSPDQQYIALANGEFLFSFVQTTNVLVVPACSVNATGACTDIAIVQCNSTKSPVIFLDNEGEAGVEITSNCLRMKGRGLELVRSADRFLYALYGIMPAS